MSSRFTPFAVVALILVCASPLLAGKGGKGKPGGGGEPPFEPAVTWYWYQSPSLYVANADGSRKTRILEAPDGSYLNPARWTPDGRLLFACDIWGPGIYVMEPDGTGATLLFEPYRYESSLRPDWSPVPTANGDYLIAYADRPLGSSDRDVFVINPDGSGRTNLTQTSDRYESTPVWSHDGTRLAFWDVGGEDIVIAEVGVLNGVMMITQETTLSDLLPPGVAVSPFWPEWAKSSNRILVTSPLGGTGLRRDIWVIDLDAPVTAVNVTDTGRTSESWGTWTTGDARVGYTDSRDNLVTVPADGSGSPTLIARKARCAAWRP